MIELNFRLYLKTQRNEFLREKHRYAEIPSGTIDFEKLEISLKNEKNSSEKPFFSNENNSVKIKREEKNVPRERIRPKYYGPNSKLKIDHRFG